MINRFILAFSFLTFTAYCSVVAQPLMPFHTTVHICATVSADSLFHGVVTPVGGDSTLCIKVTNCGDTGEIFIADIPGVGYNVSPGFSPLVPPDSSFLFCVTFRPQDYGIPKTTMKITIPGSTLEFVIPLLATTPCAKLTVLRDTIQFPLIANGTADTISVTIKNTGNLAWSPNLPQISPDDGAFSILGFDTSQILPGGSRKINIQFYPYVAGADSTVITFPNAGPCGNPVAFHVSAESGCDSIISPDSVNVTSGGGQKVFSFNLTNTGRLPWSPGGMEFVGTGASCFTLLTYDPDPIPPGGSAVFTLEFGAGNIAGKKCCAELDFPNGSPCSNPVRVLICGETTDDVKDISNAEGFTLDQNFPNPFSDKTSFTYSIPKQEDINITISDLSGNVVRTLTKGIVSAGNHLLSFDASNLASGTYIYRLQAGKILLTRELILTK